MNNKKWLWAAGSVLVFGLLTGCGTASNTNENRSGAKAEAPKKSEVTAKVSSTFETIEENNSIKVNYLVKNTSGETQNLSFTNGLKVDFILYDDQGKKLRQLSDEVVSTQALEEVTLGKDEEFSKEFIIEDVYNGKYILEVFLTAKEEEAKVSRHITVEKSLTKASGAYIGQIDPHTVELKVDGTETAYQLSEEAANQIASFKKDAQVTFVYKENDKGQKVIDKFLLEQ
ncbi:BsuPI-related putative proteinase inhibitor [Neobacillus niacini]|uniref:BsuPI-related putative proteinase inhibitor n=1 Tax=Neobacillus niacini TaxID=86668 RepID=UPI0021CB1A5D|nr:BsuPI-related putative proteinase inhibitor [Neobacillus niacini]MCM3768705.1 BsuPI-related putative proteinase inhibitor [Neobacillus niacini]